jgi:large subunit ribosomal protein L21
MGWQLGERLFLDTLPPIHIVPANRRGAFAALFGFREIPPFSSPIRASEPARWTKKKMFAVIKTGGKQYRVAASDVIEVATVSGAKGDAVAFGEVLMVGGDDGVTLGSPLVAGAQVAGEIVEQTRSATILVFKKRRRQNSKRSRGHRQHNTLVRITEILTDGKAPSRAAAAAGPEAAPAKPARKPRAKAAKAEAKE